MMDILDRNELRQRIKELENREISGILEFEDRELKIREYLDLLVR
ncbi:hypothetical protein ES702_01947 [subsurface metagenome]